MERDLDIARVAVKGATFLFWGQIISTIIGAIGTVVVARLLTPDENGLVSVALILPSIFGLFSGLGIDSAMIKNITRYRGEKNERKIGNIVRLGTIFKLSLSAILSLVSYFVISRFSFELFQGLFNKPDAAPLAAIASLTIFGGSLSAVAGSTFLGFERMEYNSIITICTYVLRSLLMPFLIIVGYGASKAHSAVIGLTSAMVLTGLISFIGLVTFTYRKGHRWIGKLDSSLLRNMLRFGIPLAAANLITIGLSHYYNFIMAAYCSPYEIGNYIVSLKFMVFASVITTPIDTTLFPTFAKFDSEKNDALRKTFEYSVRYASLLIVPVAMGTMVLAKPLTNFLFGATYATAWKYLTLLALGWLYIGFGYAPMIQIFRGQGHSKLITKLSGLSAIVGGSLAFILVPRYGIVGLIAARLLEIWPSYIVAIRNSRTKYGVGVPIKQLLRAYAASTMAAIPMLILSMVVQMNDAIKLVVCGAVGICVYFVAVPKMKALDKKDVKVLAETLGTLPYINKLVLKILSIGEKLM